MKRPTRGPVSVREVSLMMSTTHDRAKEVDHSVLSSALTWGGRRGFVRGRGESTSERALGRGGKEHLTYVLHMQRGLGQRFTGLSGETFMNLCVK